MVQTGVSRCGKVGIPVAIGWLVLHSPANRVGDDNYKQERNIPKMQSAEEAKTVQSSHKPTGCNSTGSCSGEEAKVKSRAIIVFPIGKSINSGCQVT